MPFDPTWLLAIPGLFSMLTQIFGGGGSQQQQQAEQVTEEEPRGYQSPLVGLLDPWMLETLLGRYGLLQGAGMPGGQGYQNPWSEEIIRLLGEEWPEILTRYRTGVGPGTSRTGTLGGLLREMPQEKVRARARSTLY